MSVLDSLPEVSSLFGIDLKSAAFIIAALSIVHPLFCGCTCFMPLTYLMVTMWILVVLFSGVSIMLLYGIVKDDPDLIVAWTWFTLIFVGFMLFVMAVSLVVFCIHAEMDRVICFLLSIAWYVLTLYFVFVVNSYRQQIKAAPTTPATLAEFVVDYQRMDDVENTSLRQYPPTMRSPYTSITVTHTSPKIDMVIHTNVNKKEKSVLVMVDRLQKGFRAWLLDENDDEEEEGD